MIQELHKWPRLVAGNPCLDFLNTVDPRSGNGRVDYLTNYADLLGWCVHAQLIDRTQHRPLTKRAVARRKAKSVFARAISFREALYELVRAETQGAKADGRALRRVIETIQRAWQHSDLIRRNRCYVAQPREDLELPISLLALETQRLLQSSSFTAVRMCESDRCGWVFLNLGRGPERRWCSMADCGNREKARRYALRQRRSRRPRRAMVTS